MNVATRLQRLLRAYRQQVYDETPMSDTIVLAHLVSWFLRYDAEELEFLVDELVDRIVESKQARQSEEQLTFKMVPGVGPVSPEIMKRLRDRR
jgi:hypothetical protein